MSEVVLRWLAGELGFEPRQSGVRARACDTTGRSVHRPLAPLASPAVCAPFQGSRGTGMMLQVLVGALLPAMLLAAPPPISKLALFPDKSAWCEAKNITQIVGHSGCEAKSIQNRWEPGGVSGGEEYRDRREAGMGLPVPASATVEGTVTISSHRACLGQCFSYSVPNTFPQSTESLVHCDSCTPAQSMWEIVSIPGRPCPASTRRARGPWPWCL